MDELTSDLLRRSEELLEISREAHEAADRVRKRLHRLEGENAAILKRSETLFKEAFKIVDSVFPTRSRR